MAFFTSAKWNGWIGRGEDGCMCDFIFDNGGGVESTQVIYLPTLTA